MRDLGLDRLSEDKRFLIVRDRTSGETFRLPVDQRLTSLIGPASPRGSTSGQLEIRMESALSPRDIQTRIRRGESTEQVAESAGVPVEQIEGFAGPVLAERAFMCEQARRTSIRRRHVGGAGVMLGSIVDENVIDAGGSPEAVVWDSWRREDGRWTLLVTPAGHESPATFLFDVKSRYVVPADDAAHDLVGDVALPDTSDMAIADAMRAASAERHESPAAEPGAEPTDVVDDPAESLLESEIASLAADLDVHAGVSSLKEARDRRALEQLALEETADDEPVDAEVQHAIDELDDSIEHDVAVPDTMGPRKKRHERRRVPSWDEIMFGDSKD